MRIYCDGSCDNNGVYPNTGGYGVVILDNEDNIIETYNHREKNTTNNIMEIKAILYCMLVYGKKYPYIEVHSDSAYAINIFTKWGFNWRKNNWKKNQGGTPENLDLIKLYFDLYDAGHRIELIKVKGHKGNYGNELADKLAAGKQI